MDQGLLETINGAGNKLITGTLSNGRYIYAIVFCLPLLVILYLPIITGIFIFTRGLWRNSVSKIEFTLSILSFLAPIIAVAPDLILHTDTTRFFNMMFVSAIFIYLFILYQKHMYIILALKECVAIAKRYKVQLLIAVIWICSIGCLQWKYGTIYTQNFVERLLKLVGL